MKLDILEKAGSFNKVRTTDGEIGWAKSTFMVKDKPAILVVKETQGRKRGPEKRDRCPEKGKTRCHYGR
jgi:hypothetical protein